MEEGGALVALYCGSVSHATVIALHCEKPACTASTLRYLPKLSEAPQGSPCMLTFMPCALHVACTHTQSRFKDRSCLEKWPNSQEDYGRLHA